jgi:hypothetical protein
LEELDIKELEFELLLFSSIMFNSFETLSPKVFTPFYDMTVELLIVGIESKVIPLNWISLY